MKLVIFLACLVAAFAVPDSTSMFLDALNIQDHIKDWEQFKTDYQKKYKDVEEEITRFKVFVSHSNKIKQHNAEETLDGRHGFETGINEFADLSTEEFVRKLNGYKSKPKSGEASLYLEPENVELAATVDWRPKGYVTPVKNQGQCGSCWAFSATGSLEGQHFKKTKKLVSLSEQDLVDCSGSFGNDGCEGGLMDQAFQYIKANKGIDTETSYPYTAEDGTCSFKNLSIGATDTGFVDIPPKNEKALQKAVATVGPISVAIDASNWSFQMYKKGIYNEPQCSQDQLDHGVLAVGYGKAKGKAFWLVKNSWGPSWGMKGYINMSRNKNNQCGIATDASYPLV